MGFSATGGLFAAVLLGGVSWRRKWAALCGLVLLAIAFTAIGCGGSSSSPKTKAAGPRTYIVTVTGTGTNGAGTALSHSTEISFTVR
jgi:hypothetical protein